MIADDFLKALQSGLVCVHPSDSLPGLACDPLQKSAREALLGWKGRRADLGMIGLTSDFEKAARFGFMPEGAWTKSLQEIWPAPLTVIVPLRDQKLNSSILAHPSGGIAMRVPQLSKASAWLYDVLQKISYPLPSTSVNHSGQKPALTWSEAESLVAGVSSFFVPRLPQIPDFLGQPSTLIRITGPETFSLIRLGAFDPQTLIDRGLRNDS